MSRIPDTGPEATDPKEDDPMIWFYALLGVTAAMFTKQAVASTGPTPRAPTGITSPQMQIEPIYIQARTRDLDAMARTVWAEARGEGAHGMLAVANVINNRKKTRRWGNTIEDVVYFFRKLQDGRIIFQFSCWNPADPNRAKAGGVTTADKQFVQALEICTGVLSGRLHDPTNGATHYHTLAVSPYWAEPTKVVAQTGNHIFYRNIA